MPYKLTDATWFSAETAKAQSVLTHRMEKGRAYTVAEILALLAYVGLHYDNPTYNVIGAELIGKGIIEEV